jgi:hypothetical protein
MATVVTRFSETFEKWGFKALSIGAPVKEILQLPDFIKDFISYCNFSFPQRSFSPWSTTLACHGVRGVVPLKPLMA